MRNILFAALVLSASFLPICAAENAPPVTWEDNTLKNGIIAVNFAADGVFSIRDAASGEELLTGGSYGLPWGGRGTVESVTAEDVEDRMGKGKRVTVAVSRWNAFKYRRTAPTTRLYTYAAYEGEPALVCGFGLETPNFMSLRVMDASPLGGGTFFGGKEIASPQTLNSAAGADRVEVLAGLDRTSPNGLALTGLVDGKRRTAVWGGLGYAEFGAYASLIGGSPSFMAEDPVGRLVDEDMKWLASDTFYLDVHTREPFEALERYGRAMRRANNANPNVHDFPVLCGWSTGVLSKLPKVNDSAKLISELEAANRSGLTKYTKVSLRLEPDKYHNDTEQGWWDDERMRTHGHLIEPYPSIASWSKAMNANHGIPYIYMQLGMPSDDFARQHPEYMLFNDSSEVDKRAPGMKNPKVKHPHNQPYVTYDYTDKGFSDHFLKTWSKLREDGIRGVKVDYPASAWRPEGGFDDRHATTNSAYRRAFELLREALGPDAFIDERNLGESGRPCLEVTAGVVDTQRNWADSNAYEPAMVSISGLRWFKNRVVFNYYPDTKTVHDLSPEIRRSMLTMIHLTSGRLDLATSFSLFTPEITRDVSRIYPHYPEPITARPLDAFTGVTDPQVYELPLTPDWRQIAFYNTGAEKAVVSTAISGERAANAIGLDPAAEYHAYEFWSDTYLGKLAGTARLERELEPNHCAMISLRKALAHPQVISTDRHILQGWLDLADIRWDAEKRTLEGTAKVIGGEPFRIAVAGNGAKAVSVEAAGGASEMKPHAADGLTEITLTAEDNSEVRWALKFE